MKTSQIVLLALILFFAAFVRFYQLGEVPAGIHADEVSQAYNAYSLLETGKDMYGKSYPVLFRANGSYQPPVYTYLTIIPISLFGNTIFSARFISAISGIILVFLTFIFVKMFGFGPAEERNKQAIFSALVMAITPWGIHFSRLAVEGNLVVVFFASSMILFCMSLKKRYFFIPACLILGLSTHVYYSDRITAILFLPLFLFIFRDIFLKRKMEIIVGLVLFLITLLPHLYLAKTGAFTKRFFEVSFVKNVSVEQDTKYEQYIDLGGEFLDHYIYYFSPKNLFFDSDQNLGSITIDLSAFYPLFIIPFIVGVGYLYKRKSEPITKLLFLLVIITPLSAGLTGDLFYQLRVLDFLWVITLFISFGVYHIWESAKNKLIISLIYLVLFVYLVFTLYISAFVSSKYEDNDNIGISYIKLMDVLEKYKDKRVLIDYSGRSWGTGIRYAYLYKVDPTITQKNLGSQLQTEYYSSHVNAYETFIINNLVVKPLKWDEVCGDDVLLVGDEITVSPEQIVDHNLKLEFTVDDMKDNKVLFGYTTTSSCK